MEIEINTKKNNPLLNRTEIRFTVKHQGEKTPNREIIKSEIAEKINAKKENIIIDFINSGFGIQESSGYAKIYSPAKIGEEIERKHILKRNKIISKKEKKEDAKVEKQPEAAEEKPKEEEKPAEEKTPPQQEEKQEKEEEK
jgi:small subunit ribosomal protein S24e